jgi:tetratricopeptide (TPR) repeat protein
MLRYAILPLRFIRSRPWLSGTLAVLLCAAAIAGVNLWAWYHYRAADDALRVDDMDKARQHIFQCLRVWRWGVATRFLAARIERVSGHYAEADDQLRECVRLQHGATEQTQLEEVLLRAQAGDLKEVERGLWECVKQQHAESARILETLARIYMRDSRMAAALSALTKWLELEPQAARAWHWRGWVRERLQQPEKAIPDYEKAIEIDPQRWGVHLRLARLLLERNNPDAARPHLDELMRTHGDEPDVLVAEAQAYLLQGKEEDGIQLLDRLLQSHPTDFEALYLRGQAASQLDPPRNAEAERFFKRALQVQPVDLRALHAYYHCLEHQGKDKEAAAAHEFCDKIEKKSYRLVELSHHQLERDPHNPEILSEVGQLYLDLGDEEKGLQWLRRAIQAQEAHKPSYEIVIRYFESHGKKDEADRVRKRYFDLTGNKIVVSSQKN